MTLPLFLTSCTYLLLFPIVNDVGTLSPRSGSLALRTQKPLNLVNILFEKNMHCRYSSVGVLCSNLHALGNNLLGWH